MAGQPISLTIPPVGLAGTTYASQVNTALSTLEVELERKVVPADMTMSAHLSFLSGAVNYGVTDLKYTRYALQSEAAITAAGTPMTLFAGSTDGELYWNDNSSRQVQITTNGILNIASTGGITYSAGQYGTGGVEIRWDSGDGEYELRTGSGTNDFADIRIDDIYLSDGSSNFVRVTAPTLGGDYVLTLPTANPTVTTKLLKTNISGELVYSGAAEHDGNLTQTGTLTVSSTLTAQTTLAVTSNATVGGTLGVTGAATVGGTLGVTGVLTANSGIVVPTGDTLDLQGTARILHGDRTLVIPGCAFQPLTSLKTVFYPYGAVEVGTGETDVFLYAPLLLDAGITVTDIHWYVYNDVAGSQREFGVYYTDLATYGETPIENDTSTASGTNVDFSNTTNFDVTAAYRYFLRAYLRVALDRINCCVVTYERSV